MTGLGMEEEQMSIASALPIRCPNVGMARRGCNQGEKGGVHVERKDG